MAATGKLIAAGVEGKIVGDVRFGQPAGIWSRDAFVGAFVTTGRRRDGYIRSIKTFPAVKLCN